MAISVGIYVNDHENSWYFPSLTAINITKDGSSILNARLTKHVYVFGSCEHLQIQNELVALWMRNRNEARFSYVVETISINCGLNTYSWE